MLICSSEWGEAGDRLLGEQIAVDSNAFVGKKAVISGWARGHWQTAMEECMLCPRIKGQVVVSRV